MATTVPVIDQLPTAPNRGMSSNEYPVVADAWAAKIGPWTAQVNVATAWVGQQLAASLDYKNAAALSATAASDSAVLAGKKVGLAADQVELAVSAKNAAAGFAESAAASAQAAGGAVGFPAFAEGLDVLQIRPDKTGVQWGKVGQSVGDILETARVPDATYLPTDAVYSRATYPDLFAVVGTQEEKKDGNNFAVRPHGVAGFLIQAYAQGNGVIIGVGYNGTEGPGSYSNSVAIRSTDLGLTWSAIPSLGGGAALAAIDSDNAGVWCAIDRQGFICRSTDNGLTWTGRNNYGLPISVSTMSMVCNRKGVWLAAGFGDSDRNITLRSVNNGVNWTLINPQNSGIGIPMYDIVPDYITGSFWIRYSQYYLMKSLSAGDPTVPSTDAAIRWTTGFSAPTTSSVSVPAINAGIIGFTSGGSLYLSFDAGLTYKVIAGVFGGKVMIDPFGVIIVSTSVGYYRSQDFGETFTFGSQALASVNGTDAMGKTLVMYDAVSGVWNVGNASLTGLVRSTRQYNYDVATQFKVSARKSAKGYKTYIKGKLL
ncbi:hypothetical protein KDX38_23265 [Pseudomonas sp. CDFA 602]|uniref:WD40/YVTN/BNR-like repeat-containing protein n=1 Tax=Pseudomonas californiensis TaxID=2829823 RepID=UPI001E2A3602|nr:sialidase family protein [Pseudomonas californiensis]MCD5996513.1 hypothetical protein [Pseudomonas californiensis]MCD6002112.1 hypothetical protein [Pseudomonas californiensis]